ncbi:ABC transporter ATP-binding protein [bacterium]|nr:ABC transporter ATP-binding protein [bacterium]
MKKIFSLYKYAGKYWIYAVLCPIFMVGEAVLELQIPDQIGNLINYLRYTSAEALELMEILKYGLILLGFSFASLLSGMIGGITAAIASSGFAKNLKTDLFRKIESFSFANIDKYSTSSLITRMTTDSNWIQLSFAMSIRMLFRSPALFIYAIIKASRVSGDLSMIFFIAVPFILLGLIIIFLTAHPHFSKGIKKIDKLNEVVEENVRGIRVVKSFTKEKAEINKFEAVSKDIYKEFTFAQKIVNLNEPVMMISMYTVLIFIAVIGSQMTGTGDLTSGELYELITYSFQILINLMMMSMVFSLFIISKPSRDRVYEVLHEKPTITNPNDPIMEVKDGSIEFHNAYFKYNESSEKYVLNNINLKINSGETIGILGTTGSSKTTLISVIARLYDLSSGTVKVGGYDVKEYDLKVLRDAVSVVLQKNVLFSGTILDNLRWGNKDATDTECIEASKIAQADSFIEQFPDKYNTYIEQGGSNVSGGQKQRLCIARAILKNPKILILDDSMSAVDTKTDKLIRDGLKEYRKDITKIIVAQRCASVMDADKIVIIDNGEIIGLGNHDNLMKTSKAYQEVYYSQNKEVK